MEYRPVVLKKENWWIGWLVDLPGDNAQEPTKKRLMESLKIGAEDMLSLEIKPPPGAKLEKIAV